MKNKANEKTRFIVRAGIFSAISAILYIVLKFPLPFFPGFLEFHFDEVPIFIASFAYGPTMGIVVLIIKTLIKLPFTSTMCVGELADLVYSAFFILPATIIYNRKREFKWAVIGFVVGAFFQLAASLLINIYAMIPFYIYVMGWTEDQLISLAQIANPSIKDVKWSLGLIGILPFNIVKDSLVMAITLITYKTIHKLFDKI